MELPFAKALKKKKKAFTDTFGVRFQPWPLFITGLVFFILSYLVMSSSVTRAVRLAFYVAPIWLPLLSLWGAWKVWVTWRRSEFIAKQQMVLLEIRPPRNLVKTPMAMETFLSGIHLSPGESNWYAKYILGGVRPWWSLEMASIEGQIHFYIWTNTRYRRIVESQLYAQYPGVQIVEAPDYTKMITATPYEWSIWGCDFNQTAADPLPIKTYVEFGLDQVQKEPEQVDPIANLIEFLGSVGKGEHLWLQFVFRVHKGEKYDKKNEEGKTYTWKDEGLELINEIRRKTREPYTDPATGEERPGFPNATKGESETMAAIDRNISKLAFDVGARCVYLAKPENFNAGVIAHMIGLFKPFSTEGWNGITSTAWLKKFDDYPWEIFAEKAKDKYRKKLVEAYRRRQFFHDPFGYGVEASDLMVMSTEELATIYHIPSQSVQTPGMSRLQSATQTAPENLPT